jgi:hypothetical protein
MNPDLQVAITQVLSKISQGIDFGSSQMPDIIHQLLVWNVINSIIQQLSCVITLVGMWFLVPYLFKRCEQYEWEGLPQVFIVITTSILTLIAVISFWGCFDWLQIWIAPKVWLIEYARHLVK